MLKSIPGALVKKLKYGNIISIELDYEEYCGGYRLSAKFVDLM
jgi:hypothetical protein